MKPPFSKNQHAWEFRVELKMLLLCLLIILKNDLHAGNTPCTPTFLPTNSTDFHYFNNALNSNSSIAPPPFGGYLGPDTWLSFTMPANGQLYLILEGGTMLDPAVALYSGNCADPKLLYNVLDNNCNGTASPNILLNNLNPGQTYLLRIWAQDGFPNGDFTVYLNQNLANVPGFDAFANAIDMGECIQLTAASGNQQGCAWFQIPIDFTLPFTHTMTANFGTKDANGADGITLVYQSNGPNFCGGTGEGIGAAGMPNSAIFEFDTYQNGNLLDPAQDHCSFNVNGNMHHGSSLNGPITLGNIEDGLDHDIEFSWNPVGNIYTLYFDGAFMFSGSYDFVNNLFGGSNLAYWGYTASTGGSNNKQVICPGVVVYEFSTQEYQELSICEGENYLGYTESGFYVEFFSDGQGCSHQLNIDLTILENSPPTEIYETLCDGEYIIVDNQLFSESGFYSISSLNSNNCDSTIYLDLEVIEGYLDINPSGQLNCKNNSIYLIPTVSANLNVYFQGFSWTGQTTSNQEIIEITEPGTYELLTAVSYNGITCPITQEIEITIDDTPPDIYNINDVVIDCDSSNLETIIYADVENLPNLTYEWTFSDSLVSITDTVTLLGIGPYILTLTNQANGCSSQDTGMAILSLDYPQIEITSDTLNCRDTSIILSTTTSDDIIAYEWTFQNEVFSTASNPNIEAAGTYFVTVLNEAGCKSNAKVVIQEDTNIPTSSLESLPIDCDEDTTSIHLQYDPGLMVQWTGPNNFIASGPDLIIDLAGVYIYTLSDPTNHCSSINSTEIIDLGNSPLIELGSDTINCYQREIQLNAILDDPGATLSWKIDGIDFSGSNPISISNGGLYVLSATSPTGCTSSDSIFIPVDTISPSLFLITDTIDCINNQAIIAASYNPAYSIEWNWEGGIQSQSSSLILKDGGIVNALVTNQENGCAVSQTIEVIDIRNYPDFTLEADAIDCIQTEVYLGLKMEESVLGFEWTGPNGFSSFDENPLTSLGGTYHLHLFVEGSCDIDTSIYIVEDNASPVFNLQHDTITCLNPSAQINISSTDQVELVTTWTPSGQTVDEFQFDTEEAGQFIMILTGENGCIATDTFEILAFLDLPQASISQEGVIDCDHSNANLIVTTNENLSFSWSNSEGAMAETKDLIVDKSDTYTLIVTNVYGCESELQIEVVDSLIYPSVEAIGDDIDCANPKAILSFDTKDEYLSFEWSGLNGFNSFDAQFTTEEEGNYYITITNRHGCSDIDSVYINKNTDVPEITCNLPNEILVLLDNSNRSLPILVNSSGDYSIAWTPQIGLSCADCEEPILLENAGSEYTVQVINEFGCTSELSFKLSYETEVVVTIPNVFTPRNRDGINDFFTAYGNENIELINSMKVFDRWGQLIFSKSNLTPNQEMEGWDGTYNAKPVVPGVYVYQIVLRTTENENLLYVGDVTVLE